MSGRRRTPAARAIIYAAACGGLTRDQANELLREAGLGAQEVPESSWDMIRRSYCPFFHANPTRLGEYIYHPKEVGGFEDN